MYKYSLTLAAICLTASVQANLGVTNGTTPTDTKAAPSVAIYNQTIEKLGWPIDATCGGVLVAPQWVLTAAHCVTTLNSHGKPVSTPWTDTSQLSIGTGLHAGMKSNAQQTVAVNSIVATPATTAEMTQVVEGTHSDNQVITNDYVLLKLATPITAIQPATLPDASTTPSTIANLTAYTVGYQTYQPANEKGYLLEGQQSYSEPNSFASALSKVMTLQDPSTDPTPYVQSYLDNQDKYIGYIPTTACQHPDEGDSGDGLYVNINGTWTVVGLTDLGVAVDPQAHPTVPCQNTAAFAYLNITNPTYLQFIKTTIGTTANAL